ncbi:hypothetical protein KKE26_03695 [bacterium]|nr:hypothetical protein [bacterium]MBU1753470.1 hypothetical protein [bacterium]
MYIIAAFLPPVYFFIKKQPIAGVVHSIICFISIILVITTIGVVVGISLWFISTVCAVWDMHKRIVEKQAAIMT